MERAIPLTSGYGAASPSSAWSDEDLARVAAGGNVDAFELLVGRYTDPLFKVALRFVNDYDEASDILQQVLYKIYAGLPKIGHERELTVRPWLFKIARNACLDYLKHKKRRPGLSFSEIETTNTGWKESVAGHEPLPDEIISRQETQILVREAITRLPLRYREVVALRSATDLTFAEIGLALGIPENTVKTYFQRSKALLRSELKDKL